jgi:thiol-disulfide isomerase/thioredoxin
LVSVTYSEFFFLPLDLCKLTTLKRKSKLPKLRGLKLERMKNGILLLFSLLSNVSCCFSQTPDLIVPLSLKFDSSIYPFVYVNPHNGLLIPKVPNDSLSIYTLSRSLDFPDLNLHIPVLVGISKKGQHVIIFDKNRNNDLTDDSVISFEDTIGDVLDGNYKTFNFNLGDSLQISFDFTIIKSRVLTVHWNAFEDNFWLSIRPREYRIANIDLDDKHFELILFTLNLYNFGKHSSFLVVVDRESDHRSVKELEKSYQKLKVGDKIKFGEQFYIFDQISALGNQIYLKPITDSITTGYPGAFAPQFNFITLRNDTITSKDLLGRYTLLDFWGTWCGPCMQVMPRLKSLHSIYPKIKMIGVVFDDEIKNVNQSIQVNSIIWDQIFFKRNQKDTASLCLKLNVVAYPSYILIGPEGKIVFRDMGVDGYDRLIRYLNEIHPK